MHGRSLKCCADRHIGNLSFPPSLLPNQRWRGVSPDVGREGIDVRRLAGKAGPDIAFNAAISDLGALLCRPAQQQCDECPARKYCATALAGTRQSRAIAADDLPDPVRAQQ
jgi:hypothetical protein